MPATHFVVHQIDASSLVEAQARMQPADAPKGISMATALVGATFAWAWVVAALFVGQERTMGDVSQSCMLGGASFALAAFAALDLSGRRGPELGRTAMRALASAVSLVAILFVLSPVGGLAPAVAVDAAWAAYGVIGAYAIRRSFHLLASLAGQLDGRQVLRVACGILALSTVLGLMASRMGVSEGAVFMLTSATVGVWLLPQGRLAACGTRDGAPARTPGGTWAAAQGGRGKAGRGRRLALKRLLPFAFTFIVIGFTCGFHTSVGRALYNDYPHFGYVFFVLLAACWLCALIGKRSKRCGRDVPAISLQVPLACACVAFVPLLFLDDRPDDLLWELFQNSLVFLSTCALLASISMLACADGASGPRGRAGEGLAGTDPYCAVGAAMCALGLFIGWLSGQAAYDAGGAAGLAFRLSVTLCIALLVTSILVASNPMAHGVSREEGATAGRGGMSGEAETGGGAEGTDGFAGVPIVAYTLDGGLVRDGVEVLSRLEANGSNANGSKANGTKANGTNRFEAACETAASGAETVGAATTIAATATAAADAASSSAIDEVCARYGLSERERVLLGLLAEGLNALQAADRLTVSRNTVKSHMAHIYAKTGVHTRSELEELLEDCG